MLLVEEFKNCFSRFFLLIVSIVTYLRLVFVKMCEYRTVDKILLNIHQFIIEYIEVLTTIHQNSEQLNTNMLTIQLGQQSFLLPAMFNYFSQRAYELQHLLRSYIRKLAQKRRNNICKGIEFDDENVLINHRKEPYQFDHDFKHSLEQLQKKLSDTTMNKMIRYIRTIVDDFEFYDDIQFTKQHSLNITFRLLPVLKHIQKQV